jgi:hypothetical protein
MRDPDRLVDAGEDLEVALLRSALPDAPSQGSKRSMLVALGIASGVATASAEATAAGTLAKVGLTGLLKWVGIGVIGGAAMVGVVETVVPRAAPVSRVETVEPPTLVRAPAEPTPPTVKEQAPAPPTAVEEVASARPSPRAALSQEPGASTTSLADEVHALDGARKALAGGNARECLAKLESYRAAFPRGVLGLEATVLRIEALAASGARTQARDLGTRFLESHPDSAHAARVRSVIGGETIP